MNSLAIALVVGGIITVFMVMRNKNETMKSSEVVAQSTQSGMRDYRKSKHKISQ